MVDQEHGWETREIVGKAATVTTCELCGRQVESVTPLDTDKAVFGEPQAPMLICADCQEIQARRKEPLPEPDEDTGQ